MRLPDCLCLAGCMSMWLSVCLTFCLLLSLSISLWEQLAAFDTTLQHDYALRPSLTRLSNAWHACNLLIGEKEVGALCPEYM